jgi:hypothetical protein
MITLPRLLVLQASSLGMLPINWWLQDTGSGGRSPSLCVRKGNIEANILIFSTARGAKARVLSQTVQRQGMEFVQVDDVTDSDLTKALEGMLAFICDITVAGCIILGVSAIIHIASPLPGKANLDVSYLDYPCKS